jgi:hypothetical protein
MSNALLGKLKIFERIKQTNEPRFFFNSQYLN